MDDISLPHLSLEDIKATRIAEINRTTMSCVVEILEQADGNWLQSDVRSCIASGKSLKEQIMSASTREDILAIVDNR